ncbi:hypothetical protein QL285_023519 [Trifolium repens]|nr:hypothetical protein QL285_023519 [Trifolium repens]
MVLDWASEEVHFTNPSNTAQLQSRPQLSKSSQRTTTPTSLNIMPPFHSPEKRGTPPHIINSDPNKITYRTPRINAIFCL